MPVCAAKTRLSVVDSISYFDGEMQVITSDFALPPSESDSSKVIRFKSVS